MNDMPLSVWSCRPLALRAGESPADGAPTIMTHQDERVLESTRQNPTVW
jgi:hypothetical protein